jgi:hypothetical protein
MTIPEVQQLRACLATRRSLLLASVYRTENPVLEKLCCDWMDVTSTVTYNAITASAILIVTLRGVMIRPLTRPSIVLSAISQ